MIYTKTESGEFGPWRGVRTARYTYARFRDRPWVLYDLQRDPFELDNLVERPQYRKLMAGLDKQILDLMEKTGDHWNELRSGRY